MRQDTMKFKSRKDISFTVIIFASLALVLGTTIFGILNGEMAQNEIWALIPLSLACILILWLYFGTYYELTKAELKYRSGPFYGKIEIERIREIEKGKTLYVGFKPATARKGLIIKYEKYNEIYISPKTNELFIEKILEINKDIIIKE